MATKKAGKKGKPAKKPSKGKKPSKKKTASPCVSIKINANGTTTPKKVILSDGGCVSFSTPPGFGADILLTISLVPGGGGGVIIHS